MKKKKLELTAKTIGVIEVDFQNGEPVEIFDVHGQDMNRFIETLEAIGGTAMVTHNIITRENLRKYRKAGDALA